MGSNNQITQQQEASNLTEHWNGVVKVQLGGDTS